MPVSPLTELTLAEASARLARRELGAVELTTACLERLDATEPLVHACLARSADAALAAARAADARLARGTDTTPLTGIPLILKDNIATRDAPTTAGSRILAGFTPPYDATVTERLRAAGAVIVAKANCDEFAMGSSTENSAFAVTRNPWDRERVPGGSSGGSTTAVAAGSCLGALGTDTGGSIRLPAAFCGVVGMKPTYGRVSRYGVIAYASSLDQVGPITRDVTDCALLLGAIAGHDPRDSTSVPRPVPDYAGPLLGAERLDGLRVGLPREYFVAGIAADVEARVRAAVGVLEGLGARVEEVSLPHTRYGIAAYYLIATAEASSNLARYDGVKYGYRGTADGGLLAMYRRTRAEGFGREVKRRIMLGTYALSAGYYDAYYLKAQQVRTLIRADFAAAFAHCDLLATPVAPSTAFRIGERMRDPLEMYLTDVCTISINLAGLPAMSIPCGFDGGGLPVGLQLVGPLFAEPAVLRAGRAYERATDWHRARPTLPPS
jgi:aspartyl-tRNA(Asn)/glutamyl-tRNA(Gln) amidotransferase subunit A